MEARRPQFDAAKAEAARKCHANLVWEHRLLWFLVIAILGLWGYHYALGRVDRQIRGEVLKKLGERFPKHLIHLERAHLEEGKAIILEGLEIALPTSDGPRNVVRAQRIVASGPLELLGLLQGQLNIKQVDVDTLVLSMWPIDSTMWSIETLGSKEEIPSTLPPIDIRNSSIRIGGATQSHEEMICHDLKAMLRIVGHRSGESPPSPSLPNDLANTYLSIQASISSGHFRRIRSESQVRIDKSAWKISGEFEELNLSDRLLAALPDPIRQKLSATKGLTCQSFGKFGIVNEQGKYSYGLRGNFREGRLQHPQLPYLLSNLQGEVLCKDGLIQVRNTRASSDKATFQVEADIHDLGSSPKATIVTNVQDLSLDVNLYKAIPESFRATWDKLGLSGLVDAQVVLTFDGYKWKPEAMVTCRDVSLQADVFPYPIRQLKGDFRYQDDVIFGENIQATANGRSVRGSLRLEKAAPRWLVDLNIESDAVPIDPNLIAALTPRGATQTGLERFIRSLEPGGSIQVSKARFLRSREKPEVLSKSIELQVYGGSIHYSEFRYPIFDIQGHVTVDNDVILLRDFHGRHDSARISCLGRCICTDSRLDDLLLEFDAQSVPLQEGLHRALPASVRELWNQAQPSGVLDKVQVKVTKQFSSQPLDVRVSIDEAGLVDAQAGYSVSLRPSMMPYLLNDISFHLEYQTGMLNINMKGYHDFSVVEAIGVCRLRQDGSWGCGFTWLPQTRVIVDTSLLSSLPEQLRQPLLTLDYRGPVNVGGSTLFVTDPSSGQPRAQEWKLQLEVEDGKLSGGNVASEIRGTVFIEGMATQTGTIATGDLMLDSLAIRKVPVSSLEGRFAIVGDKLLLGREASQIVLPSGETELVDANGDNGVQLASALVPKRPLMPRRPDRKLLTSPSLMLPVVKSPYPTPPLHMDDIRANTLSGQLYAYGVGQLDSGRVSLQIHLDNADFRNMLLDLGQSPGEANGKLYVDAQLHGSFQNLKTLSGGGVVRLRDAKLYQLPFMVRLFRLMELRAPDDGAFESADIRFEVDGDRFPLQEIALDGDIISMRGKGSVNMRREIQMDLYTYVGTRGQFAAMLGPLWGKESGATWLRVEVDGTTDNPQVRKSFAGIDNSTLEQFFPNKVRKETQETAAMPGS